MGLTIAYIILVLAGAGCVAFTVFEHKKCKQKNIDTELYNQNLETTKEWLEKETQ
jgi:ATP-dependent protease HslVU (ClpYQ) peptidase subunit